jgi:hypothetical protein
MDQMPLHPCRRLGGGALSYIGIDPCEMGLADRVF